MDQIARRVDSPEPGYYQARLCKGGPFVPAEISRTHDGQYTATINGEQVSDDKMWNLYHYARKIDAAEYNRLVQVQAWAIAHAPDQPEANPLRPVDLGALPPLLGGGDGGGDDDDNEPRSAIGHNVDNVEDLLDRLVAALAARLAPVVARTKQMSDACKAMPEINADNLPRAVDFVQQVRLAQTLGDEAIKTVEEAVKAAAAAAAADLIAARAQLAPRQSDVKTKLRAAMAADLLSQQRGDYGSIAYLKDGPAKITITDPSKVPGDYLVIDTAKIKRAARDGTSIPGVKVEATTQFIVKG